jgi:pimeloyl-ACP methyl ester carboxylesterase
MAPPLTYVVDKLDQNLVSGYTFDWSAESGFRAGSKVMWVTGAPPPGLGALLAQAIGCVARNSGHQVIIIAHSMGGLLVESASAIDPSDIAAVFTLGTPYKGSWLASGVAGQGNYPQLLKLAQAISDSCSISLTQSAKKHFKAPQPLPSKQHQKPAGVIEQAAALCHYVSERNDPGIIGMRLGGAGTNLHWHGGFRVYPLAASIQGTWQPLWPVGTQVPLTGSGDGVVSTSSQLAGGSNPTVSCPVHLLGAPRGVTLLDAMAALPCFHTNEPDNKGLLDSIVTTIQQSLIPTARISLPALYVHNGYVLGALYRYPAFPVSIGLDNHDFLSGLQWTMTSTASATANGTLNVDDCNPDCASGTTVTYPVQLSASTPQICTVAVYAQYSSVPQQETARVFNTIRVKALRGSPPSNLIGSTPALPPACNSSSQATTGPAPSPSPSSTVTARIVVPANAGWIDTGIRLNQNDLVNFTATGSWTADGANYTDPYGYTQRSADNYFNTQDLGVCAFCATTQMTDWGMLIGYLGNSPPEPGSYTSTGVAPQTKLMFQIGGGFGQATYGAGELWLAMNDDAYSGNTADNHGQVTATITVIRR